MRVHNDFEYLPTMKTAAGSAIKTQEELITVVDKVLTNESIIRSHINSFDRFIDHGLRQIMTQVFDIRYEVDAANTIEHDKTIKKYEVSVVIDDIECTHPTSFNYSKQVPVCVMPNECLLRDLTYCSPLYVNCTIEAKAYHENGTVSTKTEKIKRYMIAKMPIMVKSKLCNTYNKSKETLIQLEEDPSDQGGYFIVKGNHYIINNLESLKYNEPKEFITKGFKNELARSDVISKPGDAFENSFNVILKLLNNNSIVVNLSKAGFKDVDIPFYMIFRALGVITNKRIVELIAYSFDESDPIIKSILDTLESALSNKYTDFDKTANEVSNLVVNQDDVLEILCKFIVQYSTYKIADIKKQKDGSYKPEDLNAKKMVMNKLQQHLDMRFLPHVGLSAKARMKKAAFLGHMIRRMLLVNLGVIEPTDRDSYKNKRIYDSGISYSRSFKTQFNLMFVQRLMKQIVTKDFKNNSFAEINLQSMFKSAIKAEEFEKALMTSIVSGDKVMTVNKLTFTNKLSSQQLHHKNKLNVITALKSIETPNKNNSSKSSERAILIRQVHPTGTGYICGITSADTGVKVGMSKQLSVVADITAASSSEVIKALVYDDEQLVSVEDSLVVGRMRSDNLHKVFVNGDWVGCVKDFHQFLTKYREYRRTGKLHHYVTVSHHIQCNEIHIWCDSGRLTRPLLIVRNNTSDKNYSHDKFKQWTLITQDVIDKLRQNELGVDDLVSMGIMEYITPEEHANIYCAYEYDHFMKHVNDPLHQFTHIDIPQGIIGLVALTSVFANHNPAARVCFQSNQVKQTNSWVMKNWTYSAHKDMYFLINNEDPIVSTFAYKHIPPMGINAMVAIAIYGGYNQEDSLIVNKSSVDRGMFDSIHMTFQKTDCDQNEIICKPNPANTADIKSYANYEKLVDGLIPEGCYVNEGDCLVGKIAKLSKGDITNPNVIYTDHSLIYKEKEPAMVWKVIKAYNNEEKVFVKIIFKTFIKTEMGNKFCMPDTNEVLTSSGWKAFKDVSMEDKICSLVDGDRIEYVEPLGVYHFQHDGPMVSIQSQQISSTTTLNHKLYIKNRRRTEYELMDAEKAYTKRVQFKKDAINAYDDIDTITLGTSVYKMDDYLKLLAMFIADGWIDKRYVDTSVIVISAAKPRKIAIIEETAAALGVQYRVYSNDRKEKFENSTIGNKDVKHHIRDINLARSLAPLNTGALNKRLPEFVWSLSQRQAKLLLDTLVSFDGTRGKTYEAYYTSSKGLADDVTRLALHAGISGTLTKRDMDKDSTQMFGDREYHVNGDQYVVRLIRSKNTPMINHGMVKQQNGQDIKLTNYTGTVSCVEVPSHVFYVRENGIPHWTGNSSRAGQKGTVGFLYNEADMPFTSSGIKPDMIFNPLSLCTRMTTGVIFEGMLAKLSAHIGATPDATMFKKLDTDNIAEMLKSYGFSESGTERLYNGMTGTYMDAMIFIAPIYYQTLQKLTRHTVYANAVSPSDVLTRQPLHGKKVGGGSRMGSMESACMSVSSINFLNEKFSSHSDGTNLYVCTRCNQRAFANEEYKIFKCVRCGNLAQITKVASTYTSNLFMNELQAMSVGMKLNVKKPAYEMHEE